MGPHKVLVLSTAVLTLCWATPPPGYVKKPDNDKNPPKYEFGYDIRDGKGGRQGHLETRDGEYALGMYYVNLPDGSGQTVRYFADDWGYHPLVSYSSSTNTASSRAHFALGERAVKALAKSKDAAKIPHIDPTGGTATSSSLKLPDDVSSIIDSTGDVLKIRPDEVSETISNLGSAGNRPSSSFQEAPRLADSLKSEEQPEALEVNNLVDTNKVNGKYNSVTPVYTSQLVSSSDYSSAPSGGSSDYESQRGFEQKDDIKETGSSSYQLVDIGSVSSKSGNGISVSHSPLFLQLVSEATNTESGKSSDYNIGRKQKVTSYADNLNSALKFGDRIPSTEVHSTQLTSSDEQLQNEIYRKGQQTIQVTSSPIHQTYSSLRPIVVAEIYSTKQQTIRPIIVSPVSTTPLPIYTSKSDTSASSIQFKEPLSGSEKSNVITSQEVIGTETASISQAPKNSGDVSEHLRVQIQSNSRPISHSYSKYISPYSTSDSQERFPGSVQQGHVQNVQKIIHTSPTSISVSYGQDISHSSPASKGNSLEPVQHENLPYAQPLIYTTPSSVAVSISQDTPYSLPGSREISQNSIKQENIVQAQPLVYSTPSSVQATYSDGISYLSTGSQRISSGPIKQENIVQAQPLVYTPPSSVPISNSQGSSFLSSESQEISSVSTKQQNVPYAQPHIYTTQSPTIIPYSHGTSHSSVKEEGSSHSVATSNNGNSGHVISPLTQTVFLYPQSHVTPVIDINSASRTNAIYLSSTPASLLLPRPQEKEPFSPTGSEAHSQQQSIITVNSANTGHITNNQYTTPSPLNLSHKSQPTSFSLSKNGFSSQKSDIVAIENDNSVHIETNGIHSTTIRPSGTLSGKRIEGGVSGGYILSSTPASVYLNSQPSPVAATLTSSVLAPIQAGVSLSSTSHHKQSESLAHIPHSSPQPPQVIEQVNDIPQQKTLVEVQKAISIDFNALRTKLNGERQKSAFTAPISEEPIVDKTQVAETVKQVQVGNNQQQIDAENLNLIQYSYSQPLIGLQIGYSQPFSEPGQVLYSYNPQTFESQKFIYPANRYQQQVQSGIRYGLSGQLFKSGKQGYSEEVQSGIIDYPGQQKQQQILTEPQDTAEEYQYKQPLLILNTENHQQDHRTDSSKQQVTTTYNEQSANGQRQFLHKQQFPVATHLQAGYSQQLIQNGQIQNYQPLVQQVYREPLQISQPIEIQEPIRYNIHQQVNEHLEYQTPVTINQQLREQGSDINTYYNQQFITPSGFTKQGVQIIKQESQINDQATQTASQVQPVYNKNPAEIEKQLQTEYKHQLEEEDKQEQVKLSSKINESVKQFPANYKQIGEDEKHITPSHESFGDEYVQSEQRINLIPIPPETKFLEDEKRVLEEQTKIIEIEKPIAVHHTKVIEKAVPVPHAVPVEVTKLVAVEKPVPYPQLYAVPQPYPIPYVVPQPIGVPVPHLVPYPHVVTLPYKEVHPVYVRGKPYKYDTVNYRYQVQNYIKDTPLPMIMKALHHHGGRYGYPVHVKNSHYHSLKMPESLYLTPPPFKSNGRGPSSSKYHDHLRTLCMEYGFKPPLVPSKQVDGIPPSAYGPPRKE